MRIFTVFFIFVLFAGCTQDETIVIEKEPAVESILVGGSESVLPILELIAEDFESYVPDKKIIFGAPGHSGAGVRGVNNGVFDMGAVSRVLKESEKEYGLREVWFARDALVFAVNIGLELEDLALDDLRGIYYGDIENWQELGGPDEKIVVLDRYNGSSPQVLLYQSAVFTRERSITGRAIVIEKPQEMDAAILGTPYSIGYTSLAAIKRGDYKMRVLSLDGAVPSAENVRKGEYTLARPQGLVLRDEPDSSVEEFIEYIFSERGRAILERNGYVPLERES